jgi:hypothetical protein
LRHTKLLSDAVACLLQIVFACAVITATSATRAVAQTRPGDVSPPAPTQPTQVTRTDADEEFELNIDQRRIDEKDFHAETAVETDGSHVLQLGVGVMLRASDIEVLLLGVRGHVRFRASLAPVLRLLEARRPAQPAPARQPPP